MSRESRSGWLRHDGVELRRLARWGAQRGPDAWLRWSPPAFGLAFAALLPSARRAVRAQLRRVRGRQPALREQLEVARTFARFASCFAESLALGGPRGREVSHEVEGAPNLDAALAAGRGLIVVTAHTAGWDAVGASLAARVGREVVVVMQKERDAAARDLHDEARARAGVRVVHVGDDPLAALPLLAHLRRGGVVALQLDRVLPGARTLAVRLFGEAAELPAGPFLLAAASGAPVLPVFARRLGLLRYAVRVCPPVSVERGASPAVMGEAAGGAAAELERFVRAYPTHWFPFG